MAVFANIFLQKLFEAGIIPDDAYKCVIGVTPDGYEIAVDCRSQGSRLFVALSGEPHSLAVFLADKGVVPNRTKFWQLTAECGGVVTIQKTEHFPDEKDLLPIIGFIKENKR